MKQEGTGELSHEEVYRQRPYRKTTPRQKLMTKYQRISQVEVGNRWYWQEWWCTFTGNNHIETYGNEDFTGIPGQHILNSAKKSPFKNFSSNVKETFNNSDLMPQNEGFWGSVENFADQGNAKGAAQEGVNGVLSNSDPFENFLQATCKQINTPQGAAALQEQLAITYKGAPTSWGSQLIEALKSGDGIGCDMKFGKK